MMMKLPVVVFLLAASGLASAFQSHDAGNRWTPPSSGDDRGAVVFLHGMGDTANGGWASLDHMLPSVCPRLSTDKIEYIFPQAPVKGITLNGGELVPAWFDLFDFPVDSTSRDDVVGQLNAVCMLEDTVKSIEQERGIPASRIVVGGFAQGGAVAMLASYFRKERKHQPFAGCICLSGWLPNSWNFPVNSYVAEMTPLLWAHGAYDNKVLFMQQALGTQRLMKEGIDVTVRTYPCAHESYNSQEINDMAEFVDDVLFPKVTTQVATAEFVASVKYLFDHNTDQYNP